MLKVMSYAPYYVPTSKKPLLIAEVKKLINQILKHKP